MLAKGVINSINFSSNTCKVRIPQFETVNSDPIILDATISITPGIYNGYKENDVVWVAFENNMLEHPVVIGKLFLGTEKENEDPRGTINCMISTTSQKANIPQDTVLTNEVDADIPNTQVPYSNINEIANKLNDVDVNLEYSVRDIDNRIKMKVNSVDGNAAWGWELSPSGWSITSDGEEFFTVNNEGMTVKNKGKIGQFIIGAEHECTEIEKEGNPTLQSGIYTEGYYKSFEENSYNYALTETKLANYYVIVKQKGLSIIPTSENILQKYSKKNNETLIQFDRTVGTNKIINTEIKPEEIEDNLWTTVADGDDATKDIISFNNDLLCYYSKTTNNNQEAYNFLENIYYIHNLSDSSWIVNKSGNDYTFTKSNEDYSGMPNMVFLQCGEPDNTRFDSDGYYRYDDIDDDGTITNSVYISCSAFNNQEISAFESYLNTTISGSSIAITIEILPNTYNKLIKATCTDSETHETSYMYFIKLATNNETSTLNDCFLYTTALNNYTYNRTKKPYYGVYLGTDGIRVGNFSVNVEGRAELGSVVLNDLKTSSIAKTNIQDGNKSPIGCNIVSYRLSSNTSAFEMKINDLKSLINRQTASDALTTLRSKIRNVCDSQYEITASSAARFMASGKYSLYCKEREYQSINGWNIPFYLGLPKIGAQMSEYTTYTVSAKIQKIDSNSSDYDRVFMCYYDKNYSGRDQDARTNGYIIKGKNYVSLIHSGDNDTLYFTFTTPDMVSQEARIFIIGFTEVSQSWLDTFVNMTSTTNLEISKIKVEKGEAASAFSYSYNDGLISSTGISVTINYTDSEEHLDQKFVIGMPGELTYTASGLMEGDTFIVSATANDTGALYTIFCTCLGINSTNNTIDYLVVNIQKQSGNQIAQSLFYRTSSSGLSGQTPAIAPTAAGVSETMISPTKAEPYVYAARAIKNLNISGSEQSWRWATDAKWSLISRYDELITILGHDGIDIVTQDSSTGNYNLNIDKISGALSTNVIVGGFNITNNSSNPNAIYSGITSYNDSEHTEGVYLGTDGINIGQKFKVDNRGNITATGLDVSADNVTGFNDKVTGIVTANYVEALGISTKKIEVKDSSNNPIFSADADNHSTKIGGFNASNTALYTGTKTSLTDSEAGAYFGTDGFTFTTSKSGAYMPSTTLHINGIDDSSIYSKCPILENIGLLNSRIAMYGNNGSGSNFLKYALPTCGSTGYYIHADYLSGIGGAGARYIYEVTIGANTTLTIPYDNIGVGSFYDPLTFNIISVVTTPMFNAQNEGESYDYYCITAKADNTNRKLYVRNSESDAHNFYMIILCEYNFRKS